METVALESRAWRKKPIFDTEGANKFLRYGLFFAICGGFNLFFALGYLWNSLLHKDLTGILVGLFLTLFAAVHTGVGTIATWLGASVLIKKHEWIKHAASSQAFIVDRKEEYHEAGYYGDYGDYTYELALKTNHIQAVSDFTEPVMRVNVSRKVYNDYADRDVIRLYYSTTDPSSFLLQGE